MFLIIFDRISFVRFPTRILRLRSQKFIVDKNNNSTTNLYFRPQAQHVRSTKQTPVCDDDNTPARLSLSVRTTLWFFHCPSEFSKNNVSFHFKKSIYNSIEKNSFAKLDTRRFTWSMPPTIGMLTELDGRRTKWNWKITLRQWAQQNLRIKKRSR